MVYTEIQKRQAKNYHYLVHTIRLGSKYKKIRVFLGVNLKGVLLDEKITAKKTILEEKIQLYKETECFKSNITFNKPILTQKQRTKIKSIMKSYCQKITVTDKDVLRKVRESFLIKFTYHTNHAEGNTISLKETELIVKKGIVPKSHSLREVHEIENTVKAYEYIETYNGTLRHDFILKLHELVTKNTMENAKNEGSYRKKGQNVAMIGSEHFPPKGGRQIKKLIDKLIQEYTYSTLSVFENIVLFHSAFILIHPFMDGNGRVSRLMFNWMMIKNNLPPLDFPSKEHIEYTDVMEISRNGDAIPLADFLYHRLLEQFENG
ncbi:MAG: Fic family protein [Candidatus Woesearchaeota archaeon]